MAGAWVKTGKNTANSASITFTPTNTGDTLTFICCSSTGGGSPTISAVKDNNNNAFTQAVATFQDASTAFHFTIYYMLSCPAGITTITATFGSTPGTVDIWIVESSGLAGLIVSGAVAQAAPGNGTDAATSGLFNVSSQPAYVQGLICDVQNTGTIAAGTGYTSRSSTTGTARLLVEDQRVLSTGNLAATGTCSNGVDTFFNALVAFSEPVVTNADLVGPQTPTTGGTGNAAGGSSTGWWATTGFNAALSGIATTLNAYVTSIGVATTLNLAIYDSGGFLMASGSAAIANGINTITIPPVAIFQGLKYYLFWQADSSVVLADDGGSFQAHFISNTAGTFPLTIPVGGGTVGAVGIPTIYAAGTPNGVVLLAGSIFPTNAQSLGGGGGAGNMFWRINGFIATASGNATSLNLYVLSKSTATTLRMGLYDSLGNLLQQGSVAIVNGYNTIPITATPITLGQSYTIIWQADASINPADDGTASFKVFQLAHTFGALPSSVTFSSGSSIAEGVPSTFIMGPGNIPFTPFQSTQFFVQDRTVQF